MRTSFLLVLCLSLAAVGHGQVLTEANAAVVRTNRVETGVAVCGGGLAGGICGKVKR